MFDFATAAFDKRVVIFHMSSPAVKENLKVVLHYSPWHYFLSYRLLSNLK
jgi:hypothetical protein